VRVNNENSYYLRIVDRGYIKFGHRSRNTPKTICFRFLEILQVSQFSYRIVFILWKTVCRLRTMFFSYREYINFTRPYSRIISNNLILLDYTNFFTRLAMSKSSFISTVWITDFILKRLDGKRNALIINLIKKSFDSLYSSWVWKLET